MDSCLFLVYFMKIPNSPFGFNCVPIPHANKQRNKQTIKYLVYSLQIGAIPQAYKQTSHGLSNS